MLCDAYSNRLFNHPLNSQVRILAFWHCVSQIRIAVSLLIT